MFRPPAGRDYTCFLCVHQIGEGQGALVLEKSVSLNEGWYQVVGMCFISLYIGCFFWLLSDKRIGRLGGKGGD